MIRHDWMIWMQHEADRARVPLPGWYTRTWSRWQILACIQGWIAGLAGEERRRIGAAKCWPLNEAVGFYLGAAEHAEHVAGAGCRR